MSLKASASLCALGQDEEDLKEDAELLQGPRELCESLTRDSPFLPEVLQSLNDYSDIVFCEEGGRPVLLGEGSFGQVRCEQHSCSTQEEPVDGGAWWLH